MVENSYQFNIPKHHKSIIKVIGVGGGGSNAVNHMFNAGIKDVEFFVCNTDAQALKSSPIPNKLQIGVNLTEGLGAGANPERGRNAALESKEEIRDLLSDDTKMVFITAGMGGGTGTGAAPIIAKVAKELDILTVGIVTVPFAFEGKKKMRLAYEGIRELREGCDTVLVILNDKLREIYGNLAVSEAFAQADNILTTAAKGIAEIITVPGYVNVDFEDVNTVMRGSGAAVMGSTQAAGESRARRAAEEAISSPLLNNRDIHGAQKILLSIISGEEAELQMDELTEITEYIQEKAGDEAEMIFGHGIDPDLGENIRVTVIATGFADNENLNPDIPQNKTKVYDLESNQQINLFENKKASEKIQKKVNEESKGYAFQRPTDTTISDSSSSDESYFLELNDTYEIEEHNKESSISEKEESFTDPKSEMLEEKKELLKKKAQERVEKMKYVKSNTNWENNDFKEKLDVPAYLRKKVSLKDVPHSSEKSISRYNLNDDDEILGNNKFLHDNVD